MSYRSPPADTYLTKRRARHNEPNHLPWSPNTPLMLTQAQDTAPPAIAEANVGARDGAALRADLEALHPATWGWALSCCGGRHDDAEEVLQASYLKVLDGRARFHGRSSLRTWLFGVVRRTAAEHRRRRAFRGLKLALFAAQPRADRVEPGERPEAARRLDGLLEQLAERQRQVLHLVFYQELTIEQAARVMGVAVGTARTHYQRGKQALRQRLTEEAS